VSPGTGAAGAGTPSAATATRAEIVARRRATLALFATAALMNGAMSAVAPTSTIYASHYVGVAWSAFPQTLTVLGTGIGALLVVRATARLGWRSSLILAFVVATLGGVLCFGAALTANIPLLDIGTFGLGLGVGGAVISRYAAAELYPSHRRGFAIGLVVAAGAVGSVGGPLLLTPMSELMTWVGWPALSGPFLLAAVVSAIAGLGAVTLPRQRRRSEDVRPAVLRTVFRSGSARMLLIVMVVAQLVMVAIMTAAPMDIMMMMGNLTVVGGALAAHASGMFVLSPLTGWVIDRIGARKVMFAGLVVLVAAAALGAGATMSQALLGDLSLFLLGYGWNLCFLAGSRTLAVTLSAKDQGRVVGTVDAVVWGVSATGTLSGTALLSAGGYSMLSLIFGALPIITFGLLLLNRPVAAVRDVDPGRSEAAPAADRTDEAA
jgi:MFS family permease